MLNMNNVEIERRWLISESEFNRLNIKLFPMQIAISRINEHSFIRFRDDGINKRYTYTIKSGHGINRLEVEGKITSDEYINLTDELKLYNYYAGKDKYKGTLLEIKKVSIDGEYKYILEVEFESINGATNFNLDELGIIGDEVTDNVSYEMNTIYQNALG